MAESNQYSESTSKFGPVSLKRKAPLSKICAKIRVEQFPDDFYAEENVFCKFCLYSVDTIKDHYKVKNSFGKKVFSTETEDNYNFVEM